MQAGPLTVREGTTKTVYFVSGGFVEAGAAVVRVLADAAELASTIDVAAANKRKAGLKADLDHTGALAFMRGRLLLLRQTGQPNRSEASSGWIQPTLGALPG